MPYLAKGAGSGFSSQMNKKDKLARSTFDSHPPRRDGLRIGRSLHALVGAVLLFSVITAQAVTRTVTSGDDNGLGSLRQTILTALPGDTINFAAGLTTINLTSAELLIDKNLTINGPGAKLLTIQRNLVNGPYFRIFNVSSNVNATFSGLTITKGYSVDFNGAYPGGGIFINSGATVTLTLSTISGNTGRGGGGIFNSDGGTLIITNSTVSGNSGYGSGLRALGGGIYNATNATMTITNSTISGNESHYAGGIGNAGSLTLTNSTVFANDCAGGAGCGIEVDSGTVNLTNCTISGNKGDARFGANGVFIAGGTVTAKNTIIAQNSEGQHSPGDVTGTLISQGYNLIGNGSGATITPARSTDQIGTSASPIDPMLGPLQDNGGPTFTRALFSGSPARDKGNASGSTTDQRGFTRPVDNPAIPNAPGGDGSDIGAFEVQAGLSARSLNISTRARVQTGFNVLIGGFIITGNGSKKVIIRAIGPSLKKFGLTGLLADPVLELHAGDGSLITLNNDWRDDASQALQIQNSGFAPEDDLESAIIATLPTAGYTAVVRGNASGTGLGLVEVYDLDQTGASSLANISSRAFVETGDNVVIGGFNLGGTNGSPQIIIRAIGPSLTKLGITNPLANPTLELRDANAALLAFNDDWRDNPAQASQIIAAGAQPQDDLESAIAAALPPGAYTAIVAGKNGSGIGLVEIYNLQ